MNGLRAKPQAAIVVDLGCYHHPNHRGSSQDSITKLARWFRPAAIYGFDPHPAMPRNRRYVVDGAKVYLHRLAAWTHEGNVPYDPSPGSPLSAHVAVGGLHSNDTYGVPCFDLAEGLAELGDVILKMDVEGAEYPLLEHLLDTGAIQFVRHLLVEWHGLPGRAPERDALLARLGALPRPIPVEEWT